MKIVVAKDRTTRLTSGMTNMTYSSKELVMDKYEALAEARVPGKGKAARQIVEGSWDQEATNFVDQGRLDSMGYKLDDTLAINCAKGIVQRHPSINEQLKALKN